MAYREHCEFLDYNHVTEAFGRFLFEHPEPDRNITFERSSISVDAVHYQPLVYEELNNLPCCPEVARGRFEALRETAYRSGNAAEVACLIFKVSKMEQCR